ncbi:hypothetical protein D9615_003841 [Tricholomella constricta]|uniref:Protein kinase domain-containing protein n=1 Tax=Tricholomella constricta TaxID=117010 RepID=A0A8H5HHY2_9AGAR|nr:hypothetical protein D9615_003841 [Tricholomella constricta]
MNEWTSRDTDAPKITKAELWFITFPISPPPALRGHSIQAAAIQEVKFEDKFAAKMMNERVHLLRVDLLESSSAITDSKERKRATHASGKLWEVGNIKVFQDVFVTTTHSPIYTKVLHRDLSPNNLMFKRTDSKATEILHDWDLASDVEENDETLPSTATHRIGTIPFMAIDLLVENRRPPPHLFRHDLESFFYVLIWAAFCYDFDKKERRSTQAALVPGIA